MTRKRQDPHGNFLPPRMYAKHGGYYYVIRNRWLPLGREYGVALREWAIREGVGKNARTVAQAIEAYLIERSPELAIKTVRGYRNSANRLLQVFGPCLLDGGLTRPDIRNYLKTRTAPISANRDKAFLSAVFSFAVECGWCSENPCIGVRRNTERPRRRTASPDEILRLMNSAPLMWRAIIMAELLTGMRQTELRTLRRSNLTEDGIELVRPKTGTESLIEWTDELWLAIETAKSAAPVSSIFVFPAKSGGPYTSDGFSTIWTKLCDKAGINTLQFRDLRRTAATNAETLAQARALLGHTSEAMTMKVYRVRDRVKPVR